MTPEEQEAKSRKYGNEGIIVVPLRGGHFAVFNRAYDLCGIANSWDEIPSVYVAPSARPSRARGWRPTLEELGL
jgi:hypothetical protein